MLVCVLPSSISLVGPISCNDPRGMAQLLFLDAKFLEASGKLNMDEYNFLLRGGVVSIIVKSVYIPHPQADQVALSDKRLIPVQKQPFMDLRTLLASWLFSWIEIEINLSVDLVNQCEIWGTGPGYDCKYRVITVSEPI